MFRLAAVIVLVSWLSSNASLAQCPDPTAPLLTGASIYHVDGSDLITVITPPFPDDSLIGTWLRVVVDDEEPAEFFRIIGNEHFLQNNISVFTVAEDLEGAGGSHWWLYSPQGELDIFANTSCGGQAPQPGLATLDMNGAANGSGAPVSSGAEGPYFATVASGGTLATSFAGETGTTPAIVFLAAPLSLGSLVSPQGQIDLDLGQLIVVGNGLQTDPFNSFFTLLPDGTRDFNFSVPPGLGGLATGFQAVVFTSGPGIVAISNAVEVVFL